MIKGLLQLFIWQGVGEAISKLFLPSIPGAVLGLLCLLVFLSVKGEVNTTLKQSADVLTANLGLLFVPAAVGVVTFLPELKQHAFAYSSALVISVILTVAATGLVLKALTKGKAS